MPPLNITPELIPHEKFHTGVWLLPVKRPSWYYFMKRRNSNLIKTKLFIKTVDAPLRNLVKWLHKKGIRTTPSCSGHHISERDLESVYNGLEMDAEDIRTAGMKFKDVESGKIYTYRNADYRVPWSRSEFIRRVKSYQKNGIMGIHLSVKTAKKQLHPLSLSGINIFQKGRLLFIKTHENQHHNINDMWARATIEVINMLDDTAA